MMDNEQLPPADAGRLDWPVGRPVEQHARWLPASLAGRCANGYERGQGVRVHAVPYSAELASNGYCLTPALCGAKPGARSAGWSHYGMRAVNCPRCMRKTPNV